jgi:hypothetical protein
MFICNTIIYDLNRYHLYKILWCFMSWMCYTSLTTPHPVMLSIQLNHSLDNSSRTNQMVDIPFPPSHVPQTSIYAVVVTCRTSRLRACKKCETIIPTFRRLHSPTQSHASKMVVSPTQPYDCIDTFLSLEGFEKPKGFPS